MQVFCLILVSERGHTNPEAKNNTFEPDTMHGKVVEGNIRRTQLMQQK